MSAEVLVVGGGISGLACLWRLARAGVDAELVEASERLGGSIRTHAADGWIVEEGPNTVLGYPELLALVEEVGLGGERIEADPRLPRWVWRNGRLHAAPLGPGALIGTQLLSLRGKLRLLGEPWAARAPADGEESVRDFFTRRFGAELHDALVAPLVSGTFAGDSSRLSVAAVFPGVAGLERKHGSVVRGFLFGGSSRPKESPRPRMISFREGLEALPRRLGDRLGERIRLGAAVSSIAPAKDGLDLAVGSAGVRNARAVVLATDAGRAADLLRPLAPGAAAALSDVEHPPLFSVSLGYERGGVAHDLRGFGFLVPRGEGLRILGCIFVSSLFPGRAPEGRAALTTFVGGATDPDLGRLGADAVVELVREDLRRALGATGTPSALAVRRYDRAIPQYTLGHPGRVARVREEIARVPGLFVAGNFLEGVSVGECVRQAGEVADEVVRFVRGR